MSERKEGAHNPVCAPFVIDETAWTKLSERQEARPLEVRLPPTTIPSRRNVSQKGQPRKIVPRQESFRGEVAVGVEIARESASPALEQIELVDRLCVAAL